MSRARKSFTARTSGVSSDLATDSLVSLARFAGSALSTCCRPHARAATAHAKPVKGFSLRDIHCHVETLAVHNITNRSSVRAGSRTSMNGSPPRRFARARLLSGFVLVPALVVGVVSNAHAYSCPQTPSPAKTATYQGFLGRVFEINGQQLPYRLFVPANYDPSKSYPLVLYLHHAGLAGSDSHNESGWDNCVQLTSEIGSGDDYGGVFTHRGVDKNGTRFDTQAKYPHFVLAPHASSPSYGFGGGGSGSASGKEHATRPLLWGILEQVRKEFNIDAARMYVTGISMGCYGTWDIVMRSPGVFAAASPQSCRGDPDEKLLAALKDMPIWSMCGTEDSYYSGAQAMATGMKNVGATAFTFTAMQGVGHSINDRGYDYPGFLDWLFAQRLPGTNPSGTGGAAGGGGRGGSGGASGSAGRGGASAGGAGGIGGTDGTPDGGGAGAAGGASAMAGTGGGIPDPTGAGGSGGGGGTTGVPVTTGTGGGPTGPTGDGGTAGGPNTSGAAGAVGGAPVGGHAGGAPSATGGGEAGCACGVDGRPAAADARAASLLIAIAGIGLAMRGRQRRSLGAAIAAQANRRSDEALRQHPCRRAGEGGP
jgi:hypothetical protein